MIYLTLILFFLNVTALPFSCTFSDIKIKVVFLKEEFEDTKGVIRIRKSKDRQHNGQTKKDLRTNNDLQNITHKTKDQVTRTPIKPGMNVGAPER